MVWLRKQKRAAKLRVWNAMLRSRLCPRWKRWKDYLPSARSTSQRLRCILSWSVTRRDPCTPLARPHVRSRTSGTCRASGLASSTRVPRDPDKCPLKRNMKKKNGFSLHRAVGYMIHPCFWWNAGVHGGCGGVKSVQMFVVRIKNNDKKEEKRWN